MPGVQNLLLLLEYIMFNMSLSRLLLILLSVFLYAVSGDYAVPADAPPTQAHQALYPTTFIPLKRGPIVGGQPVVQAILNGTQPAAFLVDTGAAFSVLSPGMAKQLHLKLQPAVLDDGTPYFFKGKQASQVSLSTIKIGNLTISIDRGPFRVLNDRNSTLFPALNLGDTGFDGVLGVNALEHFAVLLDASQNFLGLCLPGNLDLSQVGQAGYTAPYLLPIFQRNGFWFVAVQLTNNGVSQSEDLAIDTGSNVTTISDAAAAHLGLKVSQEHATTNVYSNAVPMGESSIDTLQIGGIVLSGHDVSVAHVSKLEPPVLGMDILSGYRVLIDFPGKKMYLQSNTAAAVPAITIGPAPAPAVPPAK